MLVIGVWPRPNVRIDQEDQVMAEAATKLPVKTTESDRAPTHGGWAPMEGLRRDFNRLFGIAFGTSKRDHLARHA